MVSTKGGAASIAPDGRVSGSSNGLGWFFEGISGQYPRDELMPNREIIPDAELVGWQGPVRAGGAQRPFARATTTADAELACQVIFPLGTRWEVISVEKESGYGVPLVRMKQKTA